MIHRFIREGKKELTEANFAEILKNTFDFVPEYIKCRFRKETGKNPIIFNTPDCLLTRNLLTKGREDLFEMAEREGYAVYGHDYILSFYTLWYPDEEKAELKAVLSIFPTISEIEYVLKKAYEGCNLEKDMCTVRLSKDDRKELARGVRKHLENEKKRYRIPC